GGYFITIGALSTFLGDLLYFRIHEIEFSGCAVTNQKTLRKYANISYELNMLTLQPKVIEERLKQHPWIEQATIRRIWPDGLVVSIKEYRPRALVVVGDEESFQYLDRKGVLFATVEAGQDLDFPVITGLDVFKTEDEKKELLASANMFLRLAGENNPNLPAQNISEIHFTSEGELILYLVERPFPIYFGKGAMRRKFSQLHRVLKVLYKKKKGKAIIEDVAYIRMDYQEDKVLVARNHSG
ncbi:MAG: FtsQ-type POTRA domain-containing protein, partial [Desulfocapsa sp.]|nr:FtsQ-type POTRA domain-containing protein [Desulfocapsa sp.]